MGNLERKRPVARSYISLTTQFGNLGDEVINIILIRELAKRSTVLALAYRIPDWYFHNIRKGLGDYIKNVKFFRNPLYFLASMILDGFLSRKSFLFTSCGGLGCLDRTPMRQYFFIALQYLPSLRLAQVGVSYRCITVRSAKLMGIAQLRGESLSVRDSLSRELYSQHGVDVPIVPDLAFLLPFVKAKRKAKIIFSFRPVEPKYIAALLSHLNSAIAAASTCDIRPVITWHQEKDAEFCMWLAARLCVEAEGPTASKLDRFEQTCSIYDNSVAAISNRLHVLLIAASRGACPIGLLMANERKVRGVMTDNGLLDQVVEIESHNTMKISGLVSTACKSTATDCRHLFRKNSRMLTSYFDNVLGPVNSFSKSGLRVPDFC